MRYIKSVIQKQEPSFEEFITCFETVKRDGNSAVIKFDGERQKDQYTVFITFPSNKDRNMIRADESDLRTAFRKVLVKYIEE